MATAEESKKQFIDAVKQGTHIMVTVKADPSIDQLAACIALTVLLNDLGKRATAVYSGKMPESIDFLKPGNMLQRNTDSLQDFVISLDKDKADKLRYKVEDTMVKVYITPYRTSLSEKDLVYGRGDFNVDLVIVLGTQLQAELDRAVTSHGRILQDATVVTMNTGEETAGDLGSINWTSGTVSSLSEMLAQSANDLIIDKPDALDAQVATALMTGIVSETESFGNSKTTPSTMEVAARLLTSGANQQLVATRLSGPLKFSESDQPAASADSQDNAPAEAEANVDTVDLNAPFEGEVVSGKPADKPSKSGNRGRGRDRNDRNKGGNGNSNGNDNRQNQNQNQNQNVAQVNTAPVEVMPEQVISAAPPPEVSVIDLTAPEPPASEGFFPSNDTLDQLGIIEPVAPAPAAPVVAAAPAVEPEQMSAPQMMAPPAMAPPPMPQPPMQPMPGGMPPAPAQPLAQGPTQLPPQPL